MKALPAVSDGLCCTVGDMRIWRMGTDGWVALVLSMPSTKFVDEQRSLFYRDLVRDGDDPN